jgi:hypothetical protein
MMGSNGSAEVRTRLTGSAQMTQLAPEKLRWIAGARRARLPAWLIYLKPS